MSVSDPRRREIDDARASFCRFRRSPDRLLRWVNWYKLRSLIEGWDDETAGAYAVLGEAESFRRGHRPAESFHEANARVRSLRKAGRLRGPGVGL